MTDADATRKKAPTASKQSLGCFGIIVAMIIGAIFLPGQQARNIRNRIEPGQTLDEVLSRADGWMFATVFAGPSEKRTQSIRLGQRQFQPDTLSEPVSEFASTAEMAKALTARLASQPGGWTLSLGYLTILPKRIYFDVEFAPDGRVKSVSDTRWGRLN